MPPNTNPAEFMLDLVNNEFTDPVSVAEVIDVWDKKSAQTDVDASRRAEVGLCSWTPHSHGVDPMQLPC